MKLLLCCLAMHQLSLLAQAKTDWRSQTAWDNFLYYKKLYFYGKDKFEDSNNVYEFMDRSYLRLDCNAKPPLTNYNDYYPFPMCDTLLKKTHSAVTQFVAPVFALKGTYYHAAVTDQTTWTNFGVGPGAGAQRTVFGDATGLVFPGDMDDVTKWPTLHNDTECSVQADSCRTEEICAMSWVWQFPRSTIPPVGTDFGEWDIYKDALGQYHDSKTPNPVPMQWGMAAEGDFGNYIDGDIEFCRLCAHTACETLAKTDDEVAESARCKVGMAQKKTAKPWMKNSPQNALCDTPCAAGTWMTCDSGSAENCVYPPLLENEAYSHWSLRVSTLSTRNGITIPQVSDAFTLRRSYYQPENKNDISHCWPCALAAGITHYGRPSGKIHQVSGVNEYADFYCPGGADPPVDCTLASNGVEVKAGSDMQGTNPQSTCQCLPGYYSPKTYQSKNPSDLKCQICPAGFYCRFRAELPGIGYSANASCPVGQQKCPCPINHYCPEGSSTPRPCNMLNSCTQLQSLTQCVTGFQTEDAKCVPCRDCTQMGGKKGPCLNMIDIAQ